MVPTQGGVSFPLECGLLTSQASHLNLSVSMLANLGIDWASQDIAGACRSLRL